MTGRKRKALRILLIICLIAGAAYGTLTSLRGLCLSAMYVHETVPITGAIIDIRQRPFESFAEALNAGNLSWGGDMAYFPIVSFAFENGAYIHRLALTVPDNEPCRIGDAIELRTYPYNPTTPDSTPWRPEGVQPNRASYLWGRHALYLFASLICGAIAWLMIRKPRAKTAPAKPKQKAPAQTSAPKKTKSEHASLGLAEEPFALAATPQPAKKTRAPRKKKEAAPHATAKPRSKKPADPQAPKKPRTRKKTTGE